MLKTLRLKSSVLFRTHALSSDQSLIVLQRPAYLYNLIEKGY